ncbi:hypothetical protein SDC9_180075 [bioreactor metagenome]|uniref:Uncharacterized protein n=1 Tax=bioreactor metagenome TaxID=1076179 RepID=A0A645H0M3_9ZZZZ
MKHALGVAGYFGKLLVGLFIAHAAIASRDAVGDIRLRRAKLFKHAFDHLFGSVCAGADIHDRVC